MTERDAAWSVLQQHPHHFQVTILVHATEGVIEIMALLSPEGDAGRHTAAMRTKWERRFLKLSCCTSTAEMHLVRWHELGAVRSEP